MDRALLKLAGQLNQYDESSLMELWNEYASKVANFEPSARWEEHALAFCMIQAVHWKNQLFNAELAASARRGGKNPEDSNLRAELASLPKSHLEGRKNKNPYDTSGQEGEDKKSARGDKPCKVLSFRPADPRKS